MRSVFRAMLVLGFSFLGFAGMGAMAACGGNSGSYQLPAGEKFKPFEAPDEDELLEAEEDNSPKDSASAE